MNLPNTLTILRIILSFAVAVLLCVDIIFATTAALFIYIVAAATDWFDGYIARKQNIVTVFGKFMDSLSDKIMVIGLYIVLLGLGMFKEFSILAIFCALLTVIREFLVSGIRMLAANKNVILAAESMGKFKAGFQMYSIGAIICVRMLNIDFGGNLTILQDLCIYSGVIAMVLATILSTWSGINYSVKYKHLFLD